MTKSSSLGKKLIIGLVIVAAFAAVGFGVHLVDVRHAQTSSGTIPTVAKPSSTTNSGQAKNDTSTSQSSGSSTTAPSSQPTGTDQTAAPQTPSGNFVSNHHPTGGAKNNEASVCNTTPGASCDITFTNSDGVVKNLGKKTADANGAVFWNWTVDGANLSSGEWTVKAVATLGSQTASTTDSLKLEIQ